MKRWQLRVRAKAGGQNVDSLLDTMANVIGILIVMMAVTQLTVNDAMKRIQVWETEEAGQLREARLEAEAQLARTATLDLSQTLELARLREHIEQLRETGTVADTASVSADVASQRLQVRRLEAALADERERLANLRILVEQSESRSEEEGIALRLPDPRPAAPGSDRMVLLARHGRVFDPRFDQLTRELKDLMERAPRPLDRYFEAYDVGNEMLRWRIVEATPVRLHRLEWRRDDIGETAQELRRPDAAFRSVLANHDTKDRYLHFFVWGDSFEAYLEARRLAEEAGYSVGWIVLPAEQPLDLVSSPQGQVTPLD